MTLVGCSCSHSATAVPKGGGRQFRIGLPVTHRFITEGYQNEQHTQFKEKETLQFAACRCFLNYIKNILSLHAERASERTKAVTTFKKQRRSVKNYD